MYIIIILRNDENIIKKVHVPNFDVAVRCANCNVKRDGGEILSVTKYDNTKRTEVECDEAEYAKRWGVDI